MDVDRRRRSVAGDALTVSGSAKVPRRRSRGPERGRAGVVARETSRGGGARLCCNAVLAKKSERLQDG